MCSDNVHILAAIYLNTSKWKIEASQGSSSTWCFWDIPLKVVLNSWFAIYCSHISSISFAKQFWVSIKSMASWFNNWKIIHLYRDFGSIGIFCVSDMKPVLQHFYRIQQVSCDDRRGSLSMEVLRTVHHVPKTVRLMKCKPGIMFCGIIMFNRYILFVWITYIR